MSTKNRAKLLTHLDKRYGCQCSATIVRFDTVWRRLHRNYEPLTQGRDIRLTDEDLILLHGLLRYVEIKRPQLLTDPVYLVSMVESCLTIIYSTQKLELCGLQLHQVARALGREEGSFESAVLNTTLVTSSLLVDMISNRDQMFDRARRSLGPTLYVH
jgi:hypothetical protein